MRTRLWLVFLACAGAAAAREPFRGEHLVTESGFVADAEEEPAPPVWPRSFEVRRKQSFFTGCANAGLSLLLHVARAEAIERVRHDQEFAVPCQEMAADG